jgi:mRNA interferase MazF
MKKKTGSLLPKRGDVWIVCFDPTVGSEIRKTRPAVILQNDVANRYGAVTIVAAISSHAGDDVYPTEVLVNPPEGGLEKHSVVLLNQIRTIDKVRLVNRIGKLGSITMKAVDRAVLISMGLTNV